MSNVEERLADLEARVETLEEALTLQSSISGRDRYDSSVLVELREADSPVSVAQLHKWYRRAGIRSESKIKRRLRDLNEDGLIERIGPSWRYAGPRQQHIGEVDA